MTEDYAFSFDYEPSITFYGKDNEQIGKLTFGDDSLSFVGKADDCADLFLDELVVKYSDRAANVQQMKRDIVDLRTEISNLLKNPYREGTEGYKSIEAIALSVYNRTNPEE